MITDPYETVVGAAQPANVDLVMIEGRILKRRGKLVVLDEKRIVADAATALDQDIEDIPVLGNGAPEIMMLPMNREKDFIEMPRVAGPRAPAPELMGVRLPERPAPLVDGFIGHDHPTDAHQLFDIPVAEAEADVEPDTVADDPRRKTMACRGVGRH
jgi:hypothetical protein